MRQLLDSIHVAQEISGDVWSLTLFEDGFRLNVGQVEAMTFRVVSKKISSPNLFEIRLLLHGNITDEVRAFIEKDEKTHKLLPSIYESVPQPQYLYAGSGTLKKDGLPNDSHQKIKKVLALLASAHTKFIEYAAHTRKGEVRKKSSFRKSHSKWLYIYAQYFASGSWNSAHVSHAKTVSFDVGKLPFQEEWPVDEKFIEGASVSVKVNACERNSTARKKCVEHYGTQCVVCSFDFGVAYGKVADGYIHVHHLRPLASIGKEYVIDPIKDLRPVCANCHAAIHFQIPPYSIEEVKGMLAGDTNI